MSILLSLIIWTPIAGLALILLLPDSLRSSYKWIGLVATSTQLLLSLVVFLNFDSAISALQFVEKHDWITLSLGSFGTLSIQYFLGVDGLNLLMVLLSGIVMVIGSISSWNISKSQKGYFALYMLLSTSVVGSFLSLDMFLFYLFFEFMLLPMYFLIGIWGGKRREYASIKFFLYTLLGSILILIVMIGLYASVIDPGKTGEPLSLTGPQVQSMLQYMTIDSGDLVHTFDMTLMTDINNFVPNSILSLSVGKLIAGCSPRLLAFLALMIGFAIKLPAVPLHTWLPDAHVEAPTPISVVLAGILLKIGGYGFIRLGYAIFPDGAIHYAWLIALIGMISIIYGGFAAMAQKDLKKLIAYSSVSHMGFVMLGLAALTSEGVSGAIFQLFSHGIISPLLFLLVGVLYDRTKDRNIENYSGLATKLPYFTFFIIVGFFASLGLPGFSGFIGEVMVFLGAFSSQAVNGLVPTWIVVVSTFGLLLSAAYYLWTIQRMFFGSFFLRGQDEDVLTDINMREWIMLGSLAILAILFGIMPGLLLAPISEGVNFFIETTQQKGVENLTNILNNLK